MCYRVAVLMLLMLFAVLPVMNIQAAPAPAPSAILQIEPPPKGWSMDKHLESEIGDHLTDPCGMPFTVWLDPEIRKLPSVAAKKDVREARSWLAKNIRVTNEGSGSQCGTLETCSTWYLWDTFPTCRAATRYPKEDGGRRLRLSFRAGNRPEQVAILNKLLGVYIQEGKKKQQFLEECLRKDENCLVELEERIKSGQHPRMVDSYQKEIEELRSIHIPARRDEINRYKQITVIKWAR